MQLAHVYIFTNNSQLTRNCVQMKYSLCISDFYVHLSRQFSRLFSLCVTLFGSRIKTKLQSSFLVLSNVTTFLFRNCKDGFARDHEKNIFFLFVSLFR